MAMTEASSVEARSDHHSFMDYWHRWINRELSYQEMLRIPRDPETIGFVPNPGEFSSNPTTGFISARYRPGEGLFHFEEHDVPIDPAVTRCFLPTIEFILDDAKKRGINIARHNIKVNIRSTPATRQTNKLQGAHIDDTFGQEITKLIYLVSDYRPTRIFSGVFDVEDQVIDRALDEQKADADVFPLEPYEIAVMDSLTPHEVPTELVNDTTRRNFLRVWISEEKQQNQYAPFMTAETAD